MEAPYILGVDLLVSHAESKRLVALHDSGLLDSPPEEAFDRIAGLAAHLLGAPIAVVSLVEPHRQFFKAAVGLSEPTATDRQTPATHSLCKFVVASGEPLSIPDACSDDAFCDHPAVVDLDVAAYLGVPLRAPSGEVLGALCVIDTEPHAWTERDEDVLTRLSRVLTDAIEQRLTARRLVEEHRLLEGERQSHAATRSLTEYYLDALDDLFFVADAEGHLVRWNRAIESMTGLDPEALVGRSVLEFFAEGDRDGVAAAVAETLSGERGRVEASLLTTSGLRPYEFTAVGLPGGGAICGIGRDISKRWEAERAVRKSEARFRSFVEATSQVTYGADAEGNVVGWGGELWTEATGQPAEEAEGWGWVSALHPDDAPRVVDEWTRHLDEQTAYETEYRVRHQDGTHRHVCVQAVPIFDDGGALVEWVGTVTDVDEVRRLAREQAEAAQRLSLALEAADMGTFDYDPRAGTVVWSDLTRRHFGVAPDAPVVAGRFYDLVVEEDRERVREATAAVAEGRAQGLVEEYRLRRPDGAVRWFRSVGKAFRDRDGLAERVVGTVSDITEQREAEAAVRLWARAVESAGIGLLITDPTRPGNPIVDANRAFEEMAGYGLDEVIGRNCRFLQTGSDGVRDSDQQGLVELREAIAAEKPWRDVLRNYRKDGTAFWNQLTVSPVTDGAGRLTHYVGVQEDVTDRVEYQERLVEARETAEVARAAAEEAVLLKASLLANMSHEIRTPLTGVIGYADLLAETASGDDAEFVEAIQRGGHRLLDTLNSVLDLSRLEAGDHRLASAPVDIREAVAEAVALLRPQAQAAGLALEARLPESPVMARADSRALSRVVFNLASNAVKYTEAGSITVSAESAPDGGGPVIRVVDTGIGISETFLPHLFEEFRQESEGDARRYEGIGLGLAIVRRLVDAMGGEITVESEKGKGSTFTVRLPPAE